MRPNIDERKDEEISVLAEMAVVAARDALASWGGDVRDIGAVICAASNMQRPYPAIAIEVQNALGISGFAFDMNVACSSATFGIKTAADFTAGGSVDAVLVVNPEICSGHLNFRDRDSHFIFGDVATAIVVTKETLANGGRTVLDTRLKTRSRITSATTSGFSIAARRRGSGRSTSSSCRKAARSSARSCRW